MEETVYEDGTRPTPSRGVKLVLGLVFLVAVLYTILFSPGWTFLIGVAVILGVIYLVIPYVRGRI